MFQDVGCEETALAPIEQIHVNLIAVVIEHNLEVIKTADWIIDLGPEGGDSGGEIVALGPPEDIVRVARSYTGQF
jgi:excinuclease UvrABC ATPase subunit